MIVTFPFQGIGASRDVPNSLTAGGSGQGAVPQGMGLCMWDLLSPKPIWGP